MKTILVLSIFFCGIGLPALAQLTDADLNKIRLIVNEEVKAEVSAVKAELKTEIATLEQELKTEIAAVRKELKAEIAAVRRELKADIATLEQELKAEIALSEKRLREHSNLNTQNVEKRLTTYNWVIYVLTPLIVAAIGIPTAVMAWRGFKDATEDKKIRELTQEIEKLKQIVNS